MEIKTCLWDYLKQTEKNIVIYGMGDGCDKILSVCREKGIAVKGIFASDEYVRNKVVHGFPVTSYAKAKETFGDMIVLLAFGVFREDMMERILAMAKETELYAPEVPLFGGGLFDLDYYSAHKAEILQVEEMMADDASRRAFRSLLEYKLTGRILPLVECETDKTEDLLKLVPFSPGDHYVDLGAYDGDTALEWATLHPDYGSITAVEPGKKTVIKLKQNCAHLRDFTVLEGACWKEDAPLSFNGKSGRSAAVAPEGKDTVQGICLSKHVHRADFIKFDVEGAEKEALEGAAELIRKEKPTLLVSCYHRTEDLFALPLQVKKILPEYRVYLRHWPYIPAWDMVFFFTAR